MYSRTLGPYRDCPERRSVGVRGRVVGAVSIGSFELSRWRLRRTRWPMGFQSVPTGCRARLKRATETKGEAGVFLNLPLQPWPVTERVAFGGLRRCWRRRGPGVV